jgi:BNR repeat-containing family member
MPRYVPRYVTALGGVAAALLATTSGSASATPAHDRWHGSMAVQTVDSSVAARTDRRPVAGAVYDRRAQLTVISWPGANEDNYVQAYDHRRRTWSAPVFVGDGDGDSHNYPTIVQAADGHFLVFRGLHNTQLVVSRSPSAHSIAGTWTEQVISAGVAASYPMPFRARNGDIFVFYRETTETIDKTAAQDTRPMLYVRSTDNGATWQNSTQLTGDRYAVGSSDPDQLRPDNLNEIYFGQLRYDPDRDVVRIVWTLAGGGPGVHKHDVYHRNIYYATFSPRDLRFRAADGTDLGTQVNNTDQETHAKVADTAVELPGGVKSPDYIQTVGLLAAGHRPFVVWMQADAAGTLHDKISVYARRAWTTTEVGAGMRIRDMEPVSPTTWRAYTTVDTQPNIDTWLLRETRTGIAWTHESTLPTAKPVQRIELVTNFRDPIRIIATGASSARDVSVADGDITVAGFPTRG